MERERAYEGIAHIDEEEMGAKAISEKRYHVKDRRRKLKSRGPTYTNARNVGEMTNSTEVTRHFFEEKL